MACGWALCPPAAPPANPAGGIGANPVGRPAILLLALLIVGIVWLVRALAGPGSSTGTARQELDLRYARGELAREEYLQRRADLEGRGS